MSTAYDPLYDPVEDGPYGTTPLPVATALDLARRGLAEQQSANIHDHNAMLQAAVSLHGRLFCLITALDAEAEA